VSEFVEECRREWRRLNVPDAIANEMAADLTADLEEAQSEGGSPEDVLGNSAFDPRRFAASWAQARGVTSPSLPASSPRWRTPVAVALTVLLGLVTIGAGLILVGGFRTHSFAFAVRRVVTSPGSMRIFAPGPMRSMGIGPPFATSQIGGVDVHPLALLFLIIGIVGLALVAFWYWAPWSGRHRRDRGPRSPSWS
jgi:hypothetical protein